MIGKAVQCILPVAVSGMTFHLASSQVANEPKRRFYEDEKDLEPAVGTPNQTSEPAPAAPVTPSPQKLVNGVLISSPSTIEAGFRSIRESIHGVYSNIIHYTDKGYAKYHTTERKVSSTVSELHDKSEDLMPNAVYIFIAGLSGTIMARQRGLFAKATFPIILGIGSFKYFLPNTFASTFNFIWKLEQQKIPEIAKRQESLVTKSGELVTRLEQATESSQKSVDSSLESLKRSIKKYTGLNVDEDVSKK